MRNTSVWWFFVFFYWSTWQCHFCQEVFDLNHTTRYASQHIWCLSQARIKWEGCSRNGIRRRNGGMTEVERQLFWMGGAHPDGRCVFPLLSSLAQWKSRKGFGAGSPGCSRKKCCKTVVCVYFALFCGTVLLHFACLIFKILCVRCSKIYLPKHLETVVVNVGYRYHRITVSRK